MAGDNVKNFRVQIWFGPGPDSLLLGTVSVAAETAEQAIELSKNYTYYEVSGEDSLPKIHEALAEYTFNLY